MSATCRRCGAAAAAPGSVSGGLCAACARQVSEPAERGAFLESLTAPVLLMQGNPRQVVTANRRALALFGKELRQVEDHRGGQVFDCVHSFTAAGCGKDVNCERCKIKDAIVDTFVTDAAHDGVATELSIRKTGGTRPFRIQVTTEKLGEFALVRVERFEPDA